MESTTFNPEALALALHASSAWSSYREPFDDFVLAPSSGRYVLAASTEPKAPQPREVVWYGGGGNSPPPSPPSPLPRPPGPRTRSHSDDSAFNSPAPQDTDDDDDDDDYVVSQPRTTRTAAWPQALLAGVLMMGDGGDPEPQPRTP